jgi:hypothetical protein
MPRIFDSFSGQPLATSGTYYAHILTAAPVGSENLVSNLTLASPVGYLPETAIVSTVVTGAITNWDFADIIWSPLNFTVGLVGVAIVLQVGATKDSGADRPFLFFEFENGLNAPIVLTPGYFGVKFSTGTSFALSVQANTKYDVGGFVGFPLYKDLITLLASNNGTRYTPAGQFTGNQFYDNAVIGSSFNLNPTCYWIGDKPMVRELQNRHDIGYNNITFPTLPAPALSLGTAATFNGVDSYVTIGNTTLNGADFNASSAANISQLTLLFYFYPTLNNVEEILLDTTTSNTSGGYVIRKTATNKIEFLFITAGSPHTAVAFVSTPSVNINDWNLVLYGSYGNQRLLLINDVETSVGPVEGSFNSPILANGIRFGARRGLVPGLTGDNFNGKALYFMCGNSIRPIGQTGYPIVVNRNSQLPYNPAYATGWSLTGLNTATEMTVPNAFQANKSTFIKSVGNLNTYVGAQNLFASGASLTQMRIDSADAFYVNFGRNRVRPGTIAIIFPNSTELQGVKLDTAANSATFSVWGTNSLPGNIPTNANLINPNLWDKYDLMISGVTNSGSNTNFGSLSTILSGGYKFYLLDTNITTHYKYLRLGWKNAVTQGSGGGVIGFAHYLLFNSSVLSAELDLVPPTAGYAA